MDINKIISESGTYLLGLEWTGDDFLNSPVQFPEYTVLFITEGDGVFHADFADHQFKAPLLLFSSPLQTLRIASEKPVKCSKIQFHGDFYCIEYHRLEVACNGLLFNNIYLAPTVCLTEKEAGLFSYLVSHMQDEMNKEVRSDMVLKACLQLYLAQASNIKLSISGNEIQQSSRDETMERFMQPIDQHYLTWHSPREYADHLSMSASSLNKRCRRYFRKTPSQLIQDRLIQEAKKYLYLTNKNVKEIAYILKFQDESYFSRFFKKFTAVSPQAFRNKTGVSIVADLYQ